MKDVYIAGPLYTLGERIILEKIAHICEDLGITTYLPHRDGGICPASGSENTFFFNIDKRMLDEVRLVIAVLNGTDVDSGTAWEIGYAYSKNIHIIGFYEDTRIFIPEANINLMIYNSVELCNSLDDLEKKLKLWAS